MNYKQQNTEVKTMTQSKALTTKAREKRIDAVLEERESWATLLLESADGTDLLFARRDPTTQQPIDYYGEPCIMAKDFNGSVHTFYYEIVRERFNDEDGGWSKVPTKTSSMYTDVNDEYLDTLGAYAPKWANYLLRQSDDKTLHYAAKDHNNMVTDEYGTWFTLLEHFDHTYNTYFFWIEAELVDGKWVQYTEPDPHASTQRTADQILEYTKNLIVEKGVTYDQGQERSFSKIANAFNSIHGTELSSANIAELLLILKLVRQASSDGYHKDSMEDAVSYCALMGEELENE